MSDTAEARVAIGDTRYRQIRRVTLIGSVLDFSLAVVKLVVGYVGQSQALLADAVHSLSDLATDAMVLVAAKHGSRDADETHPYGHGRIETLATVALGLALILVAVGIGWDAGTRLFHPEDLLHPSAVALVVAAVSVVSKEWIYHYTMRVARRFNSELLRANAWHSRSDAISSIVVMIGVAGSLAGLPYLDAIAAIGVALMIAQIGWQLSWKSAHELIDTALEAERVMAIRDVIQQVDGVRALHTLRTRRVGGDALVDVHIQVEPHLSVSEGHYISETVRTRLIKQIDEVQDVLVHIDPEDDESASLSINLPSRRTILDQLRQQWQTVPGSEFIDQLTFHYLDGMIEVDVMLSLASVSDLSAARQQSEQLAAAAEALAEVRRIRVFYH